MLGVTRPPKKLRCSVSLLYSSSLRTAPLHQAQLPPHSTTRGRPSRPSQRGLTRLARPLPATLWEAAGTAAAKRKPRAAIVMCRGLGQRARRVRAATTRALTFRPKTWTLCRGPLAGMTAPARERKAEVSAARSRAAHGPHSPPALTLLRRRHREKTERGFPACVQGRASRKAHLVFRERGTASGRALRQRFAAAMCGRAYSPFPAQRRTSAWGCGISPLVPFGFALLFFSESSFLSRAFLPES